MSGKPQVPDFLNAKIDGVLVKQVIKDHKWLEEEFTVKVQKRGGLLIQKWGRSSAVSIVDAIKSLVNPTAEFYSFSTGIHSKVIKRDHAASGLCCIQLFINSQSQEDAVKHLEDA